jgi:hypothetical protein
VREKLAWVTEVAEEKNSNHTVAQIELGLNSSYSKRLSQLMKGRTSLYASFLVYASVFASDPRDFLGITFSSIGTAVTMRILIRDIIEERKNNI